MLPVTRREMIKELLLEKKTVHVSELSKMFGVSEETVRRDLSELEREGFAQKIHGGATITNRVRSYVDNSVLENIFVEHKETIARRAKDLVHEGDSIFLDSSTTCLQMARAISDLNIIVVTNSIDIATYLSKFENINLTVIGGNFDHRSRSFLGRQATGFLNDYYFDKAFISCKSLDMVSGCTDIEDDIVAVKRTVLNRSQQKIVVADHSKFDKVSFIGVCKLTELDVLVTDRPLSDEWSKYLSDSGVRFIDHELVFEKE